jgi:uncharacterized protein (TIRG00374 family)
MAWSLKQRRQRSGPPLSRPVRRTAQVLIILAIFNYGVLPQLARFDLNVLFQVNLWGVLLGFVLQAGKYVTYTIMTWAVIPLGRAPDFWTLFRIQLSSLAVSKVVPGGTAAGAVLGYRLLTTTAKLRGTDAAFAMATQGVGSAVLLNIILWLALVVSIPTRGLNPFVLPAAIAGVLLIGSFTAAVILLVRGEDSMVRILRRGAERVPFLDPDRGERFMRGVAARLQVLAEDRRLVWRASLWGTLSWLLDAASLWVFVGAFGYWVRPDGLLIAFGLANLLAAVPLTPSGLGLVEAVLIPTLTSFGAPSSVALAGVLSYRVFNFWLPIPVGGLAYLTLQVEKGIAEHRGGELRQLAEESMTRADTATEWAERHGVRFRRGTRQAPAPASDRDGTQSPDGRTPDTRTDSEGTGGPDHRDAPASDGTQTADDPNTQPADGREARNADHSDAQNADHRDAQADDYRNARTADGRGPEPLADGDEAEAEAQVRKDVPGTGKDTAG